MKKHFSILFVMAAIALVGCQTVDLTPLEKRVSELETIVHNLQEISLTGDYVTDIQPLTENGKIAGYIVTFKEHGTYTVRNGKDGDPGAPGDPGDPGAPGEDGDTWFADVTVTEDTVVFTLDDANHTQFVIPRAGAAADFGLIIEKREWTVSAGGQKIRVPYTIKGGDDQTVVSVLASEGYKATVEADKIIIVAPEEPGDAQIWAVAENGAGKSSVVVLRIKYAEAQIIAPDKTKWTVSADGNVITIDLGGESSQSAIVLNQSSDIAAATLASKFSVAATMDGEEWNDVLTDQPLAGRAGSQVFELGKFVNATKLRVTLSEPFEADLPVKLPEVDVLCGETATCELVEMTAVPQLLNGVRPGAGQPFATDGSDRFPNVGAGRMTHLADWNHNDAAYISCDSGNPCCWGAAIWGCSCPVNAKVWQTLAFTPGYYSFDVQIGHTTNVYCCDVYMVAALGDELPDIEVVTTSEATLGYIVAKDYEDVTRSIVFKVAAPGNISLGWVYNLYNIYEYTGIAWSDFYFEGFSVSGK